MPMLAQIAQVAVLLVAVAAAIDELAALCDRVVVFHQGRVSAELAGDALRTHAVLEAMNTGAAPAAA